MPFPMFCPPCEPCRAARDARTFGFLAWDDAQEGYIMTDRAWRTPNKFALARHTWLPPEPYETTRPYVWQCCPFCGGDLAPPTAIGGGDGGEA